MKTKFFTFMLFIISAFSIHAQDWNFGKRAGGTTNDYGQGIAADEFGNSYAVGFFEGTATFGSIILVSSGDRDVFVAKYDPSGNVLWAKKAGGTGSDEAKGIALDASGNLYVTGSFVSTATFGTTSLTSSGWADIFIAKYDASGNEVWAQKAGGVFADEGCAIATDVSNNVYITGAFSMTATFGATSISVADLVNTTDVFIAKYDASGNVVFAKRAGGGVYGDIAYGIDVDASNNSYITGKYYWSAKFGSTTIETGGTYDSDIFVAKFNAAGDAVWAKRAGRTTTSQSSYDQGNAIAVDASGNSFVTGSFSGTAYFGNDSIASNATFEDIFLAKYDSAGNIIWVKSAGGTSNDYGYGISIDGLGNAYITGSFIGEANFDTISISSNQDAFVAKYNPMGDILYVQKSTGIGLSAASGRGIALSSTGNVFLTGEFGFEPYPTSTVFGSDSLTSEGKFDVFIAKISNGVTGLGEYRHTVRINVYPNPATKTIELNFTENTSVQNVVILNTNGQKVKETNEFSGIDVSELSVGLYFVQVTTDKGISIQKFIKK